jgi:hypothetical protein
MTVNSGKGASKYNADSTKSAKKKESAFQQHPKYLR